MTIDWSFIEDIEIKRMYEIDGMNIEEMAKKIGVSSRPMRNKLKKIGCTIKSPHRAPQCQKEILDILRSTPSKPLREIAKTVQCTEDYVRKIRRQFWRGVLK